MDTLTRYLAVAIGSMVGGMLRYYLGNSGLSRTWAPFPTATFVINLTGSFIIGFFLTLVAERVPIGQNLRLAVAVGFVGSYTTFSTFEYETARLIEQKAYLFALLNVLLSVVIGFGAVTAGIIAGHKLGAPLLSVMRPSEAKQKIEKDSTMALQLGEVVPDPLPPVQDE